jgi:hypothetical protein
LQLQDTSLYQIANGDDNIGGWNQLWLGDNPGGPYALAFTETWQSSRDWGDVGDLPTGYWVAREVGNGVVYVGASEFSNEYDNA